ncbi:hypothetical protein A0H81_07622 [Grifola frondosa]|uniref:PH domain-containing protein n=1 Tax=Grifola frondosa TaxID=5627 RepID=A0A1C7M7Z5_GRIFR|nr:hypothetical protein A0H81_07622 [Grifola frondosa]
MAEPASISIRLGYKRDNRAKIIWDLREFPKKQRYLLTIRLAANREVTQSNRFDRHNSIELSKLRLQTVAQRSAAQRPACPPATARDHSHVDPLRTATIAPRSDAQALSALRQAARQGMCVSRRPQRWRRARNQTRTPCSRQTSYPLAHVYRQRERQLLAAASAQPPLSSIAERRSASGEESEEDEEDEEGGWRADAPDRERGAPDEIVIKTGYLWKKGERRKVHVEEAWFVLRPAHLAFYKTSAEYKLLRLLDLNEIHSCTPVALKKQRHVRARVPHPHVLSAGGSPGRGAGVAPATAPIPIPGSPTTARAPFGASRLSSSPSQSPCAHQFTSSESDDASPNGPHSYPVSSPSGPGCEVSTASKQTGAVKDASKPVLSGYLMKCGSRRHNWHKRWFVLSGEKLIYCRSHMYTGRTQDTKPHRQIPLSLILDALEYDLPPHRNNPNVSGPPVVSPPQASSSAADEGDGTQGTHTFKVVTTKRTLLLCAPSEEEEIKWLSAVRALIARRSGQVWCPGTWLQLL